MIQPDRPLMVNMLIFSRKNYNEIVSNLMSKEGNTDYGKFLSKITPVSTHAGYFSIDKKSHHIIDSKLGDRKGKNF